MSFIDYSVKMRVTQEESKLIQKICFKNGVNWGVGIGGNVRFIEHPYLYIYSNHGLRYGETASHFVESTLPEVIADDFILTEGTMDFEKYNIRKYTHGKSFEIIESTPSNTGFIDSLNKIYEKYQNHSIEVKYDTTINDGVIYKSALVIINPKNGLNL
jgi:hypothetical protein